MRRASRRSRWASRSTGIAELAKTPEGYYQIQCGIEYAIAKSLAAAPFADILWMETETANLHDAEGVRRRNPCRISRQDAGVQLVAVL